MKTIYLFLIFFFASLLSSLSQILPPGISWKRSDRLSEFPPTFSYQDGYIIDEVSEDWWSDHKNSYDNGDIAPENFNGFITCGYSRIMNVDFSESNGGCHSSGVGTSETCYEELDFTEYDVIWGQGVYNGGTVQIIGRYDQHGKLLWFKSYGDGWLSRVIQTSDGNYIAVGTSSSTRDWVSGDPIYYNPGAGGCTDNYMGSTCVPCSTSNRGKISVIKVDPNGNVIWNYVYGLTPINSVTHPGEERGIA